MTDMISPAPAPDPVRRPAPHPIRSLRAAAALFAVGLLGIAALYLALPPVPDLPRWAFIVNPTVMLAVFAVAGSFIAPVCGLRSRIAARVSGVDVSLVPDRWVFCLTLGVACGLFAGLVDHATRPFWQDAHGLTPALPDGWRLASLTLGMFYGGLVEEITLRWGAMSLAVLLVWKAFAAASNRPSPTIVWVGIAIAALLFAFGHLPALASSGADFTPALVFRTLFWNATLGLVFGALFARYDLESAMLCHAGFHLGIAPAAVVIAGLA